MQENLISQEKPQISDYSIIAPDDPSGRAFLSKFEQAGLDISYNKVDIRPRVIKNERSTNTGVYADLLDALRAEYAKGHSRILIACNTLQFWAQELMQHPELYENMPDLKLYTTFDVAKEAYPDRTTRPIWLGTSVTSSLLAKEDFDTPTNSDMNALQDEVQEIIWRTKATSVPPADFSGASAEIEDITNKSLLKEKVLKLVDNLKASGVRRFFLGCTELPIAFSQLTPNDLKGIEAIDIAELMAGKVLNEIN